MGTTPSAPGSHEQPAFETDGLLKQYGRVRALAGVDLTVEAGTVFGLLGPNGAGKTTMVRVLTTLLPPDGGTARVAGYDVVRDARRVRQMIGLAGQYPAVDENLTGPENLTMVGQLYHLRGRAARARARELLVNFNLADAAHQLVRTYSGGMRRRLDLAAALVAYPRVLFLDEPTSGLDPRSRLALWEAIEALVDEGTTVLLTTHDLDEADRLAGPIAVMDQGRIIAEGTSDELKAQVGGERLEVKLGGSADPQGAVTALSEMGDARPTVEDGYLRLPLHARSGAIAEAVRRLDEAGVTIDDIALRRPTLDDVFLELTGHAAERDPVPDDKEVSRG